MFCLSKKNPRKCWVGLRIRTAFTLHLYFGCKCIFWYCILARLSASLLLFFSIRRVFTSVYYSLFFSRVESSMYYYFVYCTCSSLVCVYLKKSKTFSIFTPDLGSKYFSPLWQIQRQIQPHWRVPTEGGIHEDGQLHWRTFLWQTHQGITLLLLKMPAAGKTRTFHVLIDAKTQAS